MEHLPPTLTDVSVAEDRGRRLVRHDDQSMNRNRAVEGEGRCRSDFSAASCRYDMDRTGPRRRYSAAIMGHHGRRRYNSAGDCRSLRFTRINYLSSSEVTTFLALISR